jgi:exonuclease SbcC
MEELMSGFIQLLTDGRHESVELSEDFSTTLYENGVPVEVISGGTEDIAALAMRLALSQMIAERAGHPLSLLVLDEPFGSLDETRRQNVITLIRRLGSVFKQVIVISHVAETKDCVDHVIELTFDEAGGKTVVAA